MPRERKATIIPMAEREEAHARALEQRSRLGVIEEP